MADVSAYVMVRGMYRNRRLLDVAHNAPCMFRVPGVCRDQVDPCVPCHSNEQRHGRGKDNKSHDVYAPSGCGPCHYWYDFGKDASREEKQAAFQFALERWWLWLFRNEKVRVV